MTIPKILYKYRDVTDSFHRNLITHAEIYLSRRAQFKDINDAAIPFKYRSEQLTEENLRKKLRELLEKTDSNLKEFEIENRILQRLSQTDFKTDEYWRDTIPFFKETINEKIGILSLAGDWNHTSLWDEYAANRSGFCVGFDTKKLEQLFSVNIRKVEYLDELVEVDLFAGNNEGLIKSICRKHPRYAYEDEFRLFKTMEAGSKKYLPFGIIEKVILGDKMEHAHQANCLRQIKIYQPGVKVYILRFEENSKLFKKERLL